jgi:TRAP-type C4-dicarboxylate transport system permease small subunit
MKRTYEKERVAALSAGLAVIVLAWIAMPAFASNWIDSIGILSVWLYGPISAAAWGLLSAISYVLIIRAQGRNPALCPEQRRGDT